MSSSGRCLWCGIAASLSGAGSGRLTAAGGGIQTGYRLASEPGTQASIDTHTPRVHDPPGPHGPTGRIGGESGHVESPPCTRSSIMQNGTARHWSAPPQLPSRWHPTRMHSGPRCEIEDRVPGGQ